METGNRTFKRNPRHVLTHHAYKRLCELVDERDHGLCVICGRRGAEHHHVIFRSAGGHDAENNMVLLCTECHAKFAHGVDEKFWKEQFQGYLQSEEIKDWRERHKIRIEKIERRRKR